MKIFSKKAPKAGKIAVCITTHNRPEVLERGLREQLRFLPKGARIFVIDDGSREAVAVPEGVEYFRFEESQGIASAKNKCLELGEVWGAEHFFLFDDDTWPLVEAWEQPYLNAQEPHLMYVFTEFAVDSGKAPLSDMKLIYSDELITAYSGGTRGCMLYAHRSVLDAVGGMNPAYGKAMFEHPDWTNRIYNAGLTTYRVMDVAGSKGLFYSMDEHCEVDSSITKEDRAVHLRRNKALYEESRWGCSFAPYKTETFADAYEQGKTAIISVFTNAAIDFQHGARREADAAVVSELEASIKTISPMTHFALLTDCLPMGERVTAVTSNPYLEKFVQAYKWLKAHPEIELCFLVDATDVTINRLFWGEVERGKLYVGSEEEIVGCRWMLGQAKHPTYKRWVMASRELQLLNAGIVGGERAMVLRFLRDFLRAYEQAEFSEELNDMAVFNRTARKFYGEALVYGTGVVNNRFKSYSPTAEATEYFLHK